MSAKSDKFYHRVIQNKVAAIEEHLEGMQRDPHGHEYEPWKKEVDSLWKSIFEVINGMDEENQKVSLSCISEVWVSYITHYGVVNPDNI